jgi:anti-sigma regulatory factor (Ser/Thr protein kinase)
MDELALHILDVAENSTAAGATLVEISIVEDAAADRLEIRIRDDGRGMDAALAAAAVHPFVTTRTTRRVGLGLPLLKMAAEEAGGALTLDSTPGVGTEVVASFRRSHVDRKPLGDLAATMLALIAGHPQIDFVFGHVRDEGTIELDTRELKAQLGDVPLTAPAVLTMIRRHLEGAGDDREGENHG